MQRSPASIAPLGWPCGIDPGTVATWRKRSTVSAAPMRPKAPGTTGLSPAAEALVVAFRRWFLPFHRHGPYTKFLTVPCGLLAASLSWIASTVS